MRIIHGYQHIDPLRKSFDELAGKIFGIGFEEWYKKGFWKDKYEPWSVEENNRIVANTSANKLKFSLSGNILNSMQIGTVMTLEEFRGRGLAKKTMSAVLDNYGNAYNFFYLFANSSVLNFYPKFGFTKIRQWHLYSDKIMGKNRDFCYRKLNMDDTGDLLLLKRSVYGRIPNSPVFDVLDSQEILLWYCLGVFRDHIYYEEDQGFIIIFTRKPETLIIHDIITEKEMDFSQVIGSIISGDIRRIYFQFNCGQKSLYLEKEEILDPDDTLFIRGEFDEETPFIHPVTAHA